MSKDFCSPTANCASKQAQEESLLKGTLNSQALGNGSWCQSGILLTEQSPIVSFNCGQLPEHGNPETSYCRSQQTLSINVGLIIDPCSQEERERDRGSYQHKKQMRKMDSQNRAFELQNVIQSHEMDWSLHPIVSVLLM